MNHDSPSQCCCDKPLGLQGSDVSKALHAARVAHFYRQGIAGIRGSLTAAVILVIFLWGAVPKVRLVVWFALYAIACGIGEILYRRFCAATDSHRMAASWGAKFAALSVAGGVLWGTVPIFLFPAESILHQALMTFVLGGMSIGIAISHGAIKSAHVPFIIAVYGPLICRFVYEGSETQIAMGTLLAVFMVYLIGAAGRMQASVTESLNLRFRNQGLIEVLKEEKEETDRLNKSLEMEVQERRQAQQALLESEERFHQLYAMSPHPMVVHDGNVILSLNRASAKIVAAHEPEELVGQSIWGHIHPDSVAETRLGIERLAQNKYAVQFSDLRFLTRDGKTVDVEVVSVPTTYKGMPAILAVGRDVTESRRSEEQLKTSLAEKEVLLREIHHRVKNNLQVISSLMRLQARFAGNKSPAEIFSESQERLLSMALIHEKLYKSNDMARIDFEAYLDDLVQQLFHSLGARESRITLKKATEKVLLGLESAIPCGLIINELVSNCIKHAFPAGRSGCVSLCLSSSDHGIEIVVADNGVGLPEGTDCKDPRTLGLRLVSTLVRQLQAEMDVAVGDGTEFKIRFQDQSSVL